MKKIGLNDCDWFVPFSEKWEWDKIISIMKSWGYVWEEQTYGIFKGTEPHWTKWKVSSKFIGVSEDIKVISWWHSLVVAGIKTKTLLLWSGSTSPRIG